MRRRRSTPWIYRWSRYIIGAIAVLGLLETAFLTVVEFTGSAAAVCPTTGCQIVLESEYAKIFGLPLTLFGFLGYTTMAILALAPLLVKEETQKDLKSQLDNTSWLLMFAIASGMLVFSLYLTYVMFFTLEAVCPYCLVSGVFSVLLFALTLLGRDWPDRGQLFFIGIIVGMITLIGALGVYANVNNPGANASADNSIVQRQAGRPPSNAGWPISTSSGEAEIALARHLTAVGAKDYSAYWCPHCHEQKELFGKQAVSEINYIECDPVGQNPQPQLCKAAQIGGYPTWIINGEQYPGVRSLSELAALSGYQGPSNFKNVLPSP
ncbi:vitamin K epoxide reductase family protein [Phormidium pseudopriestleyi FRX01]|uniref:Vitamin K epoxide reductase family protein n=1 Tax=Phormidium pseudopriestleyi FRX01 TaxID=1759528 RepID=A0ABS3FYC3_9CYAN|nr:vitamin K epoxide reductase family protein [Phormidium pseudopriestleyi]MBO0352120.1 vitamin K epoxide reductase family protein [Phormidium pseudopriestleyi FRX01]